jgi:ElaA protein
VTDDLHRATGDQLDAALLYALLTLRVNVFVVEQRSPYPDLDGRDLDPGTVHLWYQSGDAPVAYLRVLAGPPARIGRVCTAPQARGRGLGTRLMEVALAELGSREVVLDAQVQAQGMYARFGFRPEGDPFDDDGVMHITMRRAPDCSASVPPCGPA